MARSSPERALQRAILAELAVRLPLGAVVFHVPNQDATKSAAYGRAKVRDGVLPGFPDLGLIYQGRIYGLEVKAPDGRLNDNQIAAHPRLRAAGCEIEVVYSVADALDALAGWGVPLHAGARAA